MAELNKDNKKVRGRGILVMKSWLDVSKSLFYDDGCEGIQDTNKDTLRKSSVILMMC